MPLQRNELDMEFPHEKSEATEFGRSPGNGITPAPLSMEPLATEGEATPGPDDQNPYDEQELQIERSQKTTADDPTAGDDPYVFDDVGDAVGDVELPSFDDSSGPSLPF